MAKTKSQDQSPVEIVVARNAVEMLETAIRLANRRHQFVLLSQQKAEEAVEAGLEAKSIELSVASIVADEIEPSTGKPLYSNDTKRKAETDRQLAVNRHYVLLREKVNVGEREAKRAQAEASYAGDLFQAVVAYLRNLS